MPITQHAYCCMNGLCGLFTITQDLWFMYSGCLTPVSLAEMGSLKHNIIPFANRDESNSFAICPLSLFSCFIASVDALSTILEESGDSE